MSVTLDLSQLPFMKEVITEGESHIVIHDKADKGQDADASEAELIVFDNTSQGLGLKICGGCNADGTEDYGIFVKRVLPGGLAATAGGICDGDQMLEVNGQSMQGITYDRAVTMLRQAAASNHVELVITRDAEAQREFAEYMSRNGPIQSPSTVKNGVLDDKLIEPDAEFQRKFNSVLKDTDQDKLKENQGLLPPGKYGDLNGHISPASSCASDSNNHTGDLISLPHSFASLSNGSLVSQSRGTSTDFNYLDSLLSKRLSQDPGLKLHIDQLESALINLGLHLSPTTQMTLRESLTIDQAGMVRFEDFVDATKSIFQNELGTLKRNLSQKMSQETIQGSNNITEDLPSVVKERDQLKAEVVSLKEELRNHSQSSQNVEEQLLYIRKQAQASIEEGRSLRSKLHLSEQAQARAQQTERDYEEVVAMLENEVAQLRLQLSKSDGVNMQKRLAVLVCQLKKAESGKKTYEVATEKLMRFVEQSLEVLASLDNPPRTSEADGASSKQSKKRALLTLSNEGREVIKTVRSLMETVPLPFGWEEAYTAEGVKYYINHLNQTTTWTHPVSCMEHQTSQKTAPPPGQQKQQQKQPPPLQQAEQKHHLATEAAPSQQQTSKQEKETKDSKQQKDGNSPRLSSEQAKQAQAVQSAC